MNVLLLLALSLAPSIAIITFIYAKDEYEKEPLRLIRKSFLYGILSVLITTMISAILSIALGDSFDVDYLVAERDVVGLFLLAFFGVGLVEEFSKWLVIRRVIFHWKNFNEPLDGIVYSVMVSMGFATLENILYVFGVSAALGVNDGYVTGVLRMFTAVPSHATDAVIMGYFVGKAKFDERNSGLLLAMGLIGATAFHGIYDYFAFISWIEGLFAGAVVSLLVAGYLSVKAISIHKRASPFHPGRAASLPYPDPPDQVTPIDPADSAPERSTASESEQQ